jgi:hypothetical protein
MNIFWFLDVLKRSMPCPHPSFAEIFNCANEMQKAIARIMMEAAHTMPIFDPAERLKLKM